MAMAGQIPGDPYRLRGVVAILEIGESTYRSDARQPFVCLAPARAGPAGLRAPSAGPAIGHDFSNARQALLVQAALLTSAIFLPPVVALSPFLDLAWRRDGRAVLRSRGRFAMHDANPNEGRPYSSWGRLTGGCARWTIETRSVGYLIEQYGA